MCFCAGVTHVGGDMFSYIPKDHESIAQLEFDGGIRPNGSLRSWVRISPRGFSQILSFLLNWCDSCGLGGGTAHTAK